MSDLFESQGGQIAILDWDFMAEPSNGDTRWGGYFTIPDTEEAPVPLKDEAGEIELIAVDDEALVFSRTARITRREPLGGHDDPVRVYFAGTIHGESIRAQHHVGDRYNLRVVVD
jgi:hypothetical protein